jgi:hypothetical protein
VKRLMGEGESRAPRRSDDARCRRQVTRFTTRHGLVVMLGLVPILAVAWSAGCSDSTDGGGGNFVDPGGTFGAEITLTVTGRGRVTANIPGLDCPSDCFAKYIFPSATADGAAGGLTLKAQPTPGSSFKGWSFAAEPIGSAGRGPESCNPIKRPGSLPAVAAAALEISLPFGEVEGTPPAGKEAECAAYRKVPTVYKLTANFDVDIVDAGVDAGSGELLYASPTVGATGLDVGIAGGRLFWRYSSSGYHGIAYGDLPTGSAPQTAFPIVSPVSSIDQFEVDPSGVVYQIGSTVRFISSIGTPQVQTMSPPAGTCYAVAADTLGNVYCRTFNSIVRWPNPYITQQTVYTGIPFGYDLLIDNGKIYYSASSGPSGSGIYSLSLSAGDGGTAAPTLFASTSTAGSLSGLESSGSYIWWASSSLYACSAASCFTPTNTGSSIGATGVTGARMANDTSSIYFWAASSSTIYQSYYAGGASTTVFKSGLSGIGGIAADSSYVYWTQGDGSVRRAPKGL